MDKIIITIQKNNSTVQETRTVDSLTPFAGSYLVSCLEYVRKYCKGYTFVKYEVK